MFNRVRYRRHDESIFLYAFDLIELNGDDLPHDPLEGRKTTLEMVDVAAVTWLLIDGGHLQWEAAEDRRAAQAARGDLINSLAWSAAARRR